MAREIKAPGGLTIRKTVNNVVVIDKKPSFGAFNADMTGAKGPVPGAITVQATGTNVDFSQLTEPGWVELFNMDDAETVQYGIWDRVLTTFFPLGELEPGQGVSFKLSRDFGERHDEGVGTGTTDTSEVKLRMYSESADVAVYVGAYER